MTTPIMSERQTAIIGAILVALGPVSMALYTPAMPRLVEVFGTDISSIKLTLTIYFAGFTLAQLFCGPLSDAFGRRPIVLAFSGIYLLGSVIAVFADSVAALLAARLLQGVGASAGIAISRAIVRDQFTGQASARIMNLVGLMLAVGPALAPTIGGLTLETLGWRAIFFVMVAYGIGIGVLAIFFMAETNAFRDRGHIAPRRLASSYARLLADARFLRPSIILGTTLGSIYTMATMLPFVIIERVGLTPSQFGYSMMLQSGSFFLGSLVTRSLLKRFSAERIVPFGMALIVLGCVGLALFTRAGNLTLLHVMGPVAVFAFGIAVILPSMSTRALFPFPQFAGAASALMGFFQMGGGLAGSFAAVLVGDPVVALGTIVPVMGLIALVLYLLPDPAGVEALGEAGE
ncbi:multidrug effflux MFS transporter [Stappia sp. F7233]|uniref:Bcr/CflA family efflux transporter n=1 Tax=Stappia albiluteola TaxID=2758565 RepID=A0A839AI26_9HYPH|nr:multidrug effflux MFS transporter [Stappia albiluteola]MBA5778584.1 multidrug effflux MFS transporter [Stappia albiluteola]